jgi:hypothetical protein
MNFLKISKQIAKKLKILPKFWDGQKSILEMKESNYPHWKQMEWIGFYFQFLCEKHLLNIIEIPGPKINNVTFDGFKEIPWDFKAHAINTSSHQIIVNDREAVTYSIYNYGAVGIILALGKVLYNDDNRTFQKWHEDLKGGLSNYSIERIKRGAWSRLRKVSFDLKQISFIILTEETLIKSGLFQKNFRNADGSARKGKVLVDLEKLDEELVYYLEF